MEFPKRSVGSVIITWEEGGEWEEIVVAVLKYVVNFSDYLITN